MYATGWQDIEIIVVDDHSQDDTIDVVKRRYPGVRLLRTPSNARPGTARNLGISAAASQWALMLDDDDLLMPDALDTISKILSQSPELEAYPVLRLRISMQRRRRRLVAGLQDLIAGNVVGDFAPLIHTNVFKHRQLRYPACRVGGENLLWYQIAARRREFPGPTNVIQLTRDAPLSCAHCKANWHGHASMQSFRKRRLGTLENYS